MTNPLANDLDRIFDRHPALWEGLRGSRLFISGGTGFVGSWLLEALAWANTTRNLNIRATVLTRNAEAFRHKAPHLALDPAFRFHSGDVRTFTFPSGTFDGIIHGATTSAIDTFRGEDPLAKFDTVVTGTRRILDFAVHAGVRHFLYIGSGSCYGNRPGPIDEDCLEAPVAIDPGSALGNAKRAAEFLCACYARQHGLEVTIARCFSFIGPYLPLDIHYAIGNFIRDALWRDEILVRGDGAPLRSYLYAADLVTWLLTILRQGAVMRPYNVGSDEAIGIADLARLVRDELAPRKPVRILGETSGKPGPAPLNYVPSIARAVAELGTAVETPLREAILRTAAYCQRRTPQ